MSNFLSDIEKAFPEPVETIVIGQDDHTFGDWDATPDERAIDPKYINRVLRWQHAKGFLNYEYSTGYGGVDCHAITAWSKNYVGIVGCYDGSSWVQIFPRHPVPHSPDYCGGS